MIGIAPCLTVKLDGWECLQPEANR